MLHALETIRREVVRIEVRIARQRQDPAGPRILDDDGAGEFAAVPPRCECRRRARCSTICCSRQSMFVTSVSPGTAGLRRRSLETTAPVASTTTRWPPGTPRRYLSYVYFQTVFADDVVGRIALVLEPLVLLLGDRADVTEECEPSGRADSRASAALPNRRPASSVSSSERRATVATGRSFASTTGPYGSFADDLVEIAVVDAAVVQQPHPQHAGSTPSVLRQRREFAVDVGDLRRNQPDDERRTAAHEHRAVTIVDDAARRRDRNQAHLIGLRGRAIALAVDHLHLNQAHDQRQQRQQRRPATNAAMRHTGRSHGVRLRRPARRSCRARVEAAHDEHRDDHHATLSTAASSASRKCIAPKPGGYPSNRITVQKSSARTSVAIDRHRAASGIESAKNPREKHARQRRPTASSKSSTPRRSAGESTSSHKTGGQTVERRAQRVDANRVPDDHHQHDARNDAANREVVHHRRSARRPQRRATPPRRTTAARRTARRAAYRGTTTTRSSAPRSTAGLTTAV